MAQKRITLADVARHAGVSSTTVSLVLAGRARELRISEAVELRVRASVEALRYRPNIVSVGLSTGTTRTIGFVSDTVATTRLAGDMIKGAAEAAEERGVMLFIGETGGRPEREHSLLEAMHDRRVDGVVFAAMFTRILELPDALADGPAVLLNAVPAVPTALTSVVPDELEAGRAVARLLLEAGHRQDICVVGVGPDLADSPPDSVAAVERMAGVNEVLGAAGIRIRDHYGCPDWVPEHGFRATVRMLDDGPPRAVICLNDRLAFGVLQVLDERSLRVPSDVSIVSFDDQPLAGWVRPPLTTVALPHHEMGRAAVQALFEEMDLRKTDGPRAGRTIRIPMPVRIRDSLAAPRS